MEFLPILLDFAKVAGGAGVIALLNYKRKPTTESTPKNGSDNVAKVCPEHSDLIRISSETNTLIKTFIPTVEKSISEAREDRKLLFTKTDILENDVAGLKVKIISNNYPNTEDTISKQSSFDCIVLDDFPDLAKTVSIQLENMTVNHKFKLNCDSVSTIDQAEKMLDCKMYDIAIVDMYLNGSANGIDFVNFCKRKFKSMKFLVYSGRRPDKIPTDIKDIFISKPFKRKEILQKLDTVLLS